MVRIMAVVLSLVALTGCDPNKAGTGSADMGPPSDSIVTFNRLARAIQLVQSQVTVPMNEDMRAEGYCPKMTDIALSGGCQIMSGPPLPASTAILTSKMFEAGGGMSMPGPGYFCQWNIASPGPAATVVEVSVVCLHTDQTGGAF